MLKNVFLNRKVAVSRVFWFETHSIAMLSPALRSGIYITDSFGVVSELPRFPPL